MKLVINKKQNILICLSLIVLSLTSCQKCKHDQPVAASESTHEEKNAEAKAVQYTCPMHPTIVADQPGQCPICGMNLVPMSQDKNGSETGASLSHSHAPFTLSESRRQMIGVKVGIVTEKNAFKVVDAAGRIAFDPELYTAQSEYIEALNQNESIKGSPIEDLRKSAQRMVESSRLRLKILGLSDDEIRKLSAHSSTSTGALVGESQGGSMIYAEIFEMDLSSIKADQKVVVSGEAIAKDSLMGRVVAVDRVINPATRTAKVRIQLIDKKINIRPESFVHAAIHIPLGKQLVVPFDAVMDTGKESWVYVFTEDGTFTPRPVTTGEQLGDEVVIKSGLSPGEKIVTSANFLIDSESRLKGAQAAAKEEPKEAPSAPKTPSCPEGEFWHASMNHCMKKPE